MRKILTIITAFLITDLCYSQCAEIAKLKFGGTYGDYPSSSEIARQYFYFNADTTQYCCDMSKIQKFANTILKASEDHIIKRANIDFFRKLVLQNIMVVYYDFSKLSNFYDINYDLDLCGKITYLVHYEYQFTDTIKYGFGLEFDKNGNFISEEKFPNFKTNGNAKEIIDACKAIDIVNADIRFKNKIIESVELAYDGTNNSFYWLIKEDAEAQLMKGEIEFERWYEYSSLWFHVNGNTSSIDQVETKKNTVIYCGGKVEKKEK